jgi:hypothetical protein
LIYGIPKNQIMQEFSRGITMARWAANTLYDAGLTRRPHASAS